MNVFQILVPVKKNDNSENLLSYLYNCFYKIQNYIGVNVLLGTIIKQTVILCDGNEIAQIARSVGFKNVWVEPQSQKYVKQNDGVIIKMMSSICKTEYESMLQWKLSYDFMTEEERKDNYVCNFDTSWMFLAPISRPNKHYFFMQR